MNKIQLTALAVVASMAVVHAANSTESHVHLPVQTQQSIASLVVTSNNNATPTWSGWPLQTTEEANSHNVRFLQPPYVRCGNNSSL
jgi:hypothetical protein